MELDILVDLVKNNDSVFVRKDIKDVTSDELNSFYDNKRKILVGCAPCQPFSLYTNKKKTTENDKWALLYAFAQLIKEVQPEIVSMENVPQLAHFEEGKVLKDFIQVLRDEDYFVDYLDWTMLRSQ